MECLLAEVGLILAGRMLLVGMTAVAVAVMYRRLWEEEEEVNEEEETKAAVDNGGL